MAQRTEPKDSPDDFPTPPWATRGLLEHIVADTAALARLSCLRAGLWRGAYGQGAEGILQDGPLFRCFFL
jgi:hypothetical protein